MPTLDAARFVALARSSPWRWRTLRIAVRWAGEDGRRPVRAWVRRPDRLRVETLDGDVLQAGVEAYPWGQSSAQLADGSWRPLPAPHGPLDPRAQQPEFDAEGLVARRPAETGQLRYDDPMYQDYRWVAMLDPVELADGVGRWCAEPTPDPVVVTELAEVEHHGRPAWQATVAPTPAYDPRCSCCPLLFSAASEAWEAEGGVPTLRERDPGLRYADAHRVRLDVATGVCVYSEEVGGTRAGTGHDVQIDGVDEPMPDRLFTAG